MFSVFHGGIYMNADTQDEVQADYQHSAGEPLGTGTKSAETSAPLTDSTSDSPPTANSVLAARRHRISELREQTQTHSNSLVACLGAVNSDLFEIEANLSERLRAAFQADAFSPEEVNQDTRSIDLLLRLAKQITLLTKVERQCRKDADEAEESWPRLIGDAKKSKICAPMEQNGDGNEAV
jgi:hypothetical protein